MKKKIPWHDESSVVWMPDVELNNFNVWQDESLIYKRGTPYVSLEEEFRGEFRGKKRKEGG